MKKHRNGRNQTNAKPELQTRPLDTPADGAKDLIAMKAFELYEQRGRMDGHDLEDWLKAETIILGETE